MACGFVDGIAQATTDGITFVTVGCIWIDAPGGLTSSTCTDGSSVDVLSGVMFGTGNAVGGPNPGGMS